VGQQPAEARPALGLRRGGQKAAEELNLHVFIPGVAEFLGDPAECRFPARSLLSLEAGSENLQRRTQPPRGHPRPMNVFNILGVANALELLAELLRLLSQILGGQ
jgi:hypothetical protein